MDADDQPPKPSFSPTTPAPTEPSETGGTGNGGLIIPIVIGLIGVVFGAIGIFFGLSSQKKITALQDELSQVQTSIPGQLAEATAGLSGVETKLESVGKSVEALKNRSRMDRDSTARKLDKFADEIEANRSQINENTVAISEIPKTRVIAATPAVTTESASSGDVEGSESPAPVVAAEGTHIIESGDTFGRLSAKYGVSVQAILEANPGVDPRRLAIGQMVNIPASE